MPSWYERLLQPLLGTCAALVLACYALHALPGELLLASLMVIGLPELVRPRSPKLDAALPAWLLGARQFFGCAVGSALAAWLAWRVAERAGQMPLLVYTLSALMLLTSFALAALAWQANR